MGGKPNRTQSRSKCFGFFSQLRRHYLQLQLIEPHSMSNHPSIYGWMGLQAVFQHHRGTFVQHVVLSSTTKQASQLQSLCCQTEIPVMGRTFTCDHQKQVNMEMTISAPNVSTIWVTAAVFCTQTMAQIISKQFSPNRVELNSCGAAERSKNFRLLSAGRCSKKPVKGREALGNSPYFIVEPKWFYYAPTFKLEAYCKPSKSLRVGGKKAANL